MTSSTGGRLQDQQGLLRTCVTCLNKQRGPSVPLVSPLPHPSFLPNPMLSTLIAGRWSRSPSKPSMTLLLVRAFLAAEAEHLYFFLYIWNIFISYISLYIGYQTPRRTFFILFGTMVIATAKKQGLWEEKGQQEAACAKQISLGHWFSCLWHSPHNPQSGTTLPAFPSRLWVLFLWRTAAMLSGLEAESSVLTALGGSRGRGSFISWARVYKAFLRQQRCLRGADHSMESLDLLKEGSASWISFFRRGLVGK